MGYVALAAVQLRRIVMGRSVSIFCNNHYYPSAVPALNSFFYNNVNADIKVYCPFGLNHLLREYLRKFVDIVELSDISIKQNDWLNGCKFRPAMLDQVGFDDVELFLDADMVALCNLERPLRLIESGKFVGSVEWVRVPEETEIDEDIVSQWVEIVGAPPPQEFGVYNGGFLGFNFEKHHDLIRKWSDVCNNNIIYKSPPFNNDQMVISGIIESLKTKSRSMPRRYWMTTWHIHNEPQKLLGFDENGKIKLYDSETYKPIKLYHYTGGIAQEIRGRSTVMRYYHANGESILDKPDILPDCRKAWKNLWENHHKSPAGILADHMRNSGPIDVPKVFSVDFRDSVSTLLTEIQNDDPDSKNHTAKVYAVCLAYDYLNLLDYRLGGECWLDAPLRALLGDRVYQGDKVLKWDEPSDVTLSFGKPGNNFRWTFDTYSKPGDTEHLKGVNITIN